MSVFAAGAAAQAVQECLPPPQGDDCNYPDAQPLERGADGTYAVKGVIGVTEFYLPAVQDVDLYSFFASRGDLLAIDIDGGIKKDGKCDTFMPPRCVDTTLAILGPDKEGYPVQREQASCLAGMDSGSISTKDACILNFLVPTDGIYIVAVTADPVRVFSGGHTNESTVTAGTNGEYLLIVSGASAAKQVINIDIKPRSRAFARLDLKSNGTIPVALLSNDKVDALKVDKDSLTFGAKGDEGSLRNCAWEGEYVNDDDKLDLVCHFNIQAAGFGPEDVEGVLNGTIDGKPLEGRGTLKVLPAPEEETVKSQKKQK
jgi:hypothetical protein